MGVDGFYDKRWNGEPMNHGEWIEAISSQGWHCRFDGFRRSPSTIDTAHAGQTGIVNINAAWQSLSPVLHRISAPWNGERLIVKIVKSGMLSIEQHGQATRFGPGDIAVLDPMYMFTESIREATSVAALCIPKTALRDRGLRYQFATLLAPDPESADVGAVRNFMLHLAAQAGHVSQSLLSRLGDQCIDLMDVFVSERGAPKPGRASVAVVLRVKQMIARHIGDADLNLARIAGELNMSTSSLSRALKAKGLSPMRYAWSLRLEHAARLLVGVPHGEIQSIMYRCGFTNASHFSRAFKERYGMAPREYAASQQAGVLFQGEPQR
jgi:AraC-like DNA-binding protein